MKKQKFLAALMAALMIIMSVPIYLMPASAKTAPSGAKEYKGHTYYVYKNTVSWKKAKAICESRGGHLATITSSGENSFVKKLTQDKGLSRAWLGATDEAKEGTWKWVTGEKFSYKDWDSGEPDSRRDTYDYLALQSSASHWGAWPESDSSVQGYVCEWDMSKKSVDSVRFAQTSATVYYGSTKTLTVLNTTSKITWSTSNKAVATVSSKGVVTGKGLGSCTITAKIGSKSYKCKVTVKDRNQKASVSLKTTDGGIFLYGTNSVTASFVLKSYPASKVTVYIVNTDGSSVYKKTFTSVKKGTTYKFNWNGKKSDGKVVPAGSYRMKVVVGTTNTYSSYVSFKTKNDFSGGNGSKNNPFQVSKASQFSKMIKYPKAYYKQTATIDFNYSGINGLFTQDNQFSGVYDGGGKTIKNMVATSALFKIVNEKATIKNLNFSNCSTVAKFSAILAENNKGKISNCKFTKCAVSGSSDDSKSGIIVSYNYGSISNCSASGASNSNGSGNQTGGIAGENCSTGKIINCTSTVNVGDVYVYYSYDYCGGIVGKNSGVITNCEASGTVLNDWLNDDYYYIDECKFGGLAGYNNGTITSSYYTGPTSCNRVGRNEGVLM
ncbi:MAG: lectin-like protein [Acutalibacteraceae bacterium]